MLHRLTPGALLALLSLAGCAEDLAPADAGTLPPTSGAFTHETGADGIITTTVDATDAEAWQRLDLDGGRSVDAGWDLAFRRFFVRTNGGVSGTAGVQVAVAEGAFEDVTRAPESGWSAARPDGEADDDEEPDTAFNDGEDDWYDYDPETHTLTPKDRVYVVSSSEGRFFKLQILGYYDDAGSPARLRFRWAEIAAPMSTLPDAGPGMTPDAGIGDAGVTPVPADAIEVDASGSGWVYVSVAAGVVAVTDPATSTDWDLALQRTDIRTNSGSSGPGFGGARRDARGLAFDAIEDASTLGFVTDAVRDGASPGRIETSVNPAFDGEGGSPAWYDYDPSTHRVTASDRVYLLRMANGDHAKLRIWRWEDGVFHLTLAPIARRIETATLEVDASASDAWRYVSLRGDGVVEVTEAATDAAWDLGLSRTRLRTNGGTSGEGLGAAAESAATAIGDLTSAPESGWETDVDSLAEGPPGSPTYSGNPALAGWYDYDPATHAVSPRAVVFALRSADGHLAKVQITSWADGVFRLQYAFAGPGATGF